MLKLNAIAFHLLCHLLSSSPRTPAVHVLSGTFFAIELAYNSFLPHCIVDASFSTAIERGFLAAISCKVTMFRLTAF